MRTVRTLAFVLCSIALSGFVAWVSHADAAPKTSHTTLSAADHTQSMVLTKDAVIEEVNRARIQEGLSPLLEDPLLTLAAQQKADDMVARGYFAHDTPSGAKFIEVIGGVGYAYKYAGENLAVHYRSANEVTDAWMNSPGHRANILAKRYEETGIGLAYGERKGKMGWYIVQLFGTEL